MIETLDYLIMNSASSSPSFSLFFFFITIFSLLPISYFFISFLCLSRLKFMWIDLWEVDSKAETCFLQSERMNDQKNLLTSDRATALSSWIKKVLDKPLHSHNFHFLKAWKDMRRRKISDFFIFYFHIKKKIHRLFSFSYPYPGSCWVLTKCNEILKRKTLN